MSLNRQFPHILKPLADECTIQGHTAIMLLLLASFMVVVPGTDVRAATGHDSLGRYQSGRDDDSPCADKEKYEHSK
jgi:hypothetical protein